MKLYAMLGLLCLASTTLFAAESTTSSIVKKSPITSASVSERSTSAALQMQARQLQNMKDRFDEEAELYRQAGVSDENIAKLKKLYQEIFESYQKGEQPDYAKIRKERQQLITPENMSKYRELMIKRNEEQSKLQAQSTTTSTLNTSPTVEKK